MPIDPDNPIVKLCLAGMRAEGEGHLDEASALFEQAWAEHRDDFEGCLAAHYVARHQASGVEALRWNELALALAQAVGGERVQGFFASLYLNLGHAHEALSHPAEARRYYDLAAEQLDEVPDGRYGSIVRGGIANGQARLGARQPPA